MRIDRLMGIIIYLLKRDIVNANTLAKRFEVTTRTIQRDIDTLNMAGIPIVSIQGSNGGYGIIDGFRIEKNIVTPSDIGLIKMALNGLGTIYKNVEIDNTIDKIKTYDAGEESSDVKVDFSVGREGKYIDKYIKVIKLAVNNKQSIMCRYTNARNLSKEIEVEPIGVLFKWYSWYMLAYSKEKEDYRLYKINRMRELVSTQKPFIREHQGIDDILLTKDNTQQRDIISIEIIADNSVRVALEDHFPNEHYREVLDNKFNLTMKLPSYERGWKGILFTFGNKVTIIKPESLKEEFRLKAEQIINLYKN